MQMSVHAKTQKGQEEIARRSHGLGARARRLLILVDGRRSSAELLVLTGDPTLAESLAELLEGGFIEPVVPAAPAPAAPASPAAAPGGRSPGLALARDFMINTLRTFHGPYGKLDLVKRIHASESAEGLRTLIAEWQEAIAESRIGRKRADELLARLHEVLPA